MAGRRPCRCSRPTSGSRTRARLEPAERELRVETTLDDGLVLRGYVDRLDRNAAGDTRVVDYKTGKAPGEGYEQKALFQMRFYALVLWRATGTRPPAAAAALPRQRAGRCATSPTRPTCCATERKVKALWAAIQRAHETGDWRPSPVAAVRLVRPPGRAARPSAAPRRRCPTLPVPTVRREPPVGRPRRAGARVAG